MNQSKKQLKAVLLNKVQQWIKNGDTPEEAIEKLTMRQYDFLIEQGVDFDNILLTEEQRKNITEVKRAPRSLSPNGYNKKYPQEKIDLYNSIKTHIESIGATIIQRDKENYRDLDFTLESVHYKIVLSNPREKK